MIKKLMFGVAIMFVASIASAQSAKSILDGMSVKYKEIPSFTANIDYTMVNKADGISDTFIGSIAVKGDMFSLKMGGQEIINNGVTVWTYLPDDNEVNIDNHSAEAGDITPSSIYTIYKKGFNYVLLSPVTVAGKKYDVIDLIATNKEAQFYKIRLQIAQSDKTLGKFTMYDNEGSEFSYTISKFNTKANLTEADFSFDEAKHAGVEVIDLR